MVYTFQSFRFLKPELLLGCTHIIDYRLCFTSLMENVFESWFAIVCFFYLGVLVSFKWALA